MIDNSGTEITIIDKIYQIAFCCAHSDGLRLNLRLMGAYFFYPPIASYVVPSSLILFRIARQIAANQINSELLLFVID